MAHINCNMALCNPKIVTSLQPEIFHHPSVTSNKEIGDELVPVNLKLQFLLWISSISMTHMNKHKRWIQDPSTVLFCKEWLNITSEWTCLKYIF